MKVAAALCSALFVCVALPASAQDDVAAFYKGKQLRMIVGSAVGAVAGVLIAPLTYLHSNMMLSPLIKAFAVAALGGLSSLVGAFVGGLLLGVTENIAVQYMPSYLKDSLAFVFILVVLLLRPEGLFGKQAKEKV